MIALISPAKTLEFESNLKIGSAQYPLFLEKAEQVMEALSKKTKNKLMKLQSISENLAELNYNRNQEWSRDGHLGGKQAVLAFKGDVYQGLEADNWSEADMDFANQQLRILSGLYGFLKPSDLIMPYRLEMGTDLTVRRKKSLYDFWKTTLKQHFKEDIGEETLLLNLASNEYFKAVHTAEIKNTVIEVVFKDYSKGTYKIISFFAKKARGLMANYMVQNRITSPEQLKDFNVEGYQFSTSESSDNVFIFKRKA